MLSSYNVTNIAVAATIKTGPGIIHSITLAAAADAATAIVYDNTAASGTVIAKLSAPLTDTAHAVLDVPFSIGCHVALTGTTPSFTIAYG